MVLAVFPFLSQLHSKKIVQEISKLENVIEAAETADDNQIKTKLNFIVYQVCLFKFKTQTQDLLLLFSLFQLVYFYFSLFTFYFILFSFMQVSFFFERKIKNFTNRARCVTTKQSKLQGKTSQQNGKAVQSTSLTNAKSIIKDLYTNLRKKELGPCPCHILHPGPRNTLNMLNYTLHIRKEIILENYRISIQP